MGDVYHALFTMNFVRNKKNCFLLQILSRKPSFFKKNLIDWQLMSRYSVVVTQ